MDQPIRILIVDDHEVVRRGLHSIISACDDLLVVGTAASGEEAVVLAKSIEADLVLLDLQLPGMHGLEVIPELIGNREWVPKIIVLTVHDDDEIVLRAVKAGASGYVLKHSSADELIRVIRHVAWSRPSWAISKEPRTFSSLRRTNWRSFAWWRQERPTARWRSTSS